MNGNFNEYHNLGCIDNTTKFVDDFMESSDKTLNIDLGFTVELPAQSKTYYYKPVIQIEKISDYITSDMKNRSLSLTELKGFTHDKIINNKRIYNSDYTYSRDCSDPEWCPQMPKFCLDYDKSIENMENVYKEKLQCNDISQLYDLFEKNEFVLERKNINLYIRAQDSGLHDNSVGECYYFKINNIGARYYSEN